MLTVCADGPWSSFPLQVGTPAQDVRAFISTASGFTWTTSAEGCPTGYTADCENSRGNLFLRNESLTWAANSIFNFGLEDNLGMDTSGYAGFDDVTLGWQGSGGPQVNHSIVFNVGSATYWVGEFGLNPRPTNFTTYTNPQLSFMQSLANHNRTPSRSYGYTAGNQYRYNKVFGSLTLGGYDSNRFSHKNVTYSFYEDISRDLLVTVSAVTTGNGATNLLPSGSIPMYIDSTVATIWLPKDSCKAFEDAFGLVWNENFEYYIVNSSHHDTLTSLNPTVTFTLESGSSSIEVALPYGAFDLQLQYPYVVNPNTSYYFPLKRAANETQYTLGRTFLQEAYLFADYDAGNFTVAPCSWDQSRLQSENIHPVLSPFWQEQAASANKSASSSISSAGVIAGVVVAIVAAIAILGGLLFFYRRRKNIEKRRLAELEAKEAGGSAKASSEVGEGKPFIGAPMGGELGGGEIHELTAPNKPYANELDSQQSLTDPNKAGYSEMEGGGYHGGGKSPYVQELQGSQGQVYEMPGSEVQELDGTARGTQVKRLANIEHRR